MRLILCPFATGWFSDLWVLQNHEVQTRAVAPTTAARLGKRRLAWRSRWQLLSQFWAGVQNGPIRQLTEFTYIVAPALLTMPEDRFSWPAVVMIMVPSERKKNSDDVGFLFKAPNRLALSLGLDFTRSQFSDLIPMLDAKRVRNLHFTLGAERDAEWPVRSWSTGASLGG